MTQGSIREYVEAIREIIAFSRSCKKNDSYHVEMLTNVLSIRHDTGVLSLTT